MKRNSLIIATLLTLIAASAVAQTITVRVNGNATVSGPSMTLGDIAVVEDNGTGRADIIKSVRLGVSPLPGNWRELDRQLIIRQLGRNGLVSNVKLISPTLIKVFRESQSVDPYLVENTLRDYIIANAPWESDNMTISSISRIGEVTLPAGQLTFDIRPRGDGNYLGQTPFVVDFIVDGKSARQITMQAHISVFREAVVAINAIQARRVIAKTDVAVRRIDISSAQGTTFNSVDDVDGLETTAYLQPGQILTSKHVRRPLVVKRGQMITLEAVRPGFIIRTAGLAQEDGRTGDIIRILNPNSKKQVEARVTGAGRAEVIF